MRLYSQKDVDQKALRGARIAVLGYGSQGRAHALNLHDSGFDVVVGTRKGDSWQKAKKDGLHVMEPKEAIKGAKLVAMLVPGATPKNPASGLIARSSPCGPGLIQAMSSPTVVTFHPSKPLGGISIAKLVLPQADGKAAAT